MLGIQYSTHTRCRIEWLITSTSVLKEKIARTRKRMRAEVGRGSCRRDVPVVIPSPDDLIDDGL